VSDQLATIEQKGIDEAGARFQSAVGYAKALELVQRVISSVEKAILCLVPETYDTAPAIAAARSLKQAIQEQDTAKTAVAEDHLSNEIYMWRLSLCSRDQAIQPYHLRRFCERTEDHLDLSVFAALARFYRSLPHTELAQSKYDFAVTRVFASISERDQRVLRMEGHRLVGSISEMFQLWAEKGLPTTGSPDNIRAAADRFRAFIAEANEINEFEKLIGSGLFNRVRHLKKDLGELFYVPEVTAAAIEFNVLGANKFSELLADEGQHIRDEPSACRDLTDILSDTTAIASFSKTFDDLQLAELDQQAESSEHLAQLLRLLRISNNYDEAKTQAGEEKGNQSPNYRENDCLSAEIPLTLCALMEDDDNKKIIAEFLRTPLSEERRSLDPVAFLAPLTEVVAGDRQEERQARRNSLSQILSSERLLRFKLSNNNPISPETESELSELLEDMQRTDLILRRLISEAREGIQVLVTDELLHVSNHLLGARLRLESAIVQRGTAELARHEFANKKPETNREFEPPSHVGSRKRQIAIAAVLLLAVAVLMVRAYNVRSTVAIEHRDKDVQILNVNELPGSELLVNARLKRELLVAVVSGAWLNSPDDKKREELAALLRYGKPKGIEMVMLVDSSGAQKGSVSDSHLTLE
jgi:hypothetical protein